MYLDHNLFQVSKLSKDQKTRSSPKIEVFFSPKSREDHKKGLTSFRAQMQTTVKPELGTCAATILLAIALAPQLFLNGCADACTASILAILSAIAQAQFK